MLAPRFALLWLLCLLAGAGGCLSAAGDPGPVSLSPNQPKTLIAHLRRGELNRLGFNATIEGVTGTIMVDTGASFSILNEGKYGFLLHGPERRLAASSYITTQVNDMKARVAFTRDFHLGSVDLGGSRFPLVPENELYENRHGSYRGRFGNYDGLMGEDFLRRYQAVMDCHRQLLYLSLHPIKTSNLEPVLCSNGWTRVPMEDTGTDLAVSCRVQGRACRLIVDTGAAFTTLDQAWLDNAHVASTSSPLRAAFIGKTSRTITLAKLDRLRIGDYTATDVQITAGAGVRLALDQDDEASAPGPIVGLLGSDTLAFNGAIVDIGGQALYLKHMAGGGR